MKCKKCGCERVVKNGSKNGNKYYKCKECGAQFSEVVRDSKNERHWAVVLYCFGLSLRTIGTILGYSDVTILNWVRAFAKAHYDKPMPKGEIVLELDEMWHFIRSKKTNCGFGKHIVAQLENLLTGNAEIAIPPLLQNCIID
jgi:transposase-like protein